MKLRACCGCTACSTCKYLASPYTHILLGEYSAGSLLSSNSCLCIVVACHHECLCLYHCIPTEIFISKFALTLLVCAQTLAVDISLAGLLGDNVYNFGELLLHPIVRRPGTVTSPACNAVSACKLCCIMHGPRELLMTWQLHAMRCLYEQHADERMLVVDILKGKCHSQPRSVHVQLFCRLHQAL